MWLIGVRSRLARCGRKARVEARRRRRSWHGVAVRVRQSWLLSRAELWHRIYRVRYWCQLQIARRATLVGAAALIVAVGISALLIAVIQDRLQSLFPTGDKLQGLRTLFVTIGGALLGATAIVSSLVLFSMQVNVERMPHGLFRALSGDRRLLGAFAGAYVLALSLAVLSVLPDVRWAGAATFGAGWTVILILLLFLYSYRRALGLINPMRQLRIVIETAQWEFRAWLRRAKRAAPLFGSAASPTSGRRDSLGMATHDIARLAYFRANPYWTDGARRAVRYAISLARRYAEQGDHEVSGAAMSAIISINAAYVQAKGKTFFTNQLLFDNPLTSDAFINDTLEHLRQTARVAVARRDEQQIEQTLRAFAAVARVYAAIDYANPSASKTHAHLAAGYLSAEVTAIMAHNMPDVLMEGARLMGGCAGMLLEAEGPNGVVTLVQKLGVLGCSGIAKEDYRPVTSTCMEQLAELDFNLLRCQSGDIGFAAKQVRDNVLLIAKFFLALPDTPLTSIHSSFLSPFYSVTSPQSFLQKLIALGNAIAQRGVEDKHARRVVDNVEEWADGRYATEKELLLEAIKQRSQFTFDVIHWIKQVTVVLVFVSNAPACDERTQEELRKHALWLISVLSFIPGDKETVEFVENFQMTETLFEAACDALRRECRELATDITGLLISWLFKAGRYPTGWGILERAVYGVATLALLAEGDGAIPRVKAEMAKCVAAGELPDQSATDHAALEIRGRAQTLYREGHWGSAIEREMAQLDHAKLQPLLEELADLISPGTKGQAARHRLF